MTSAPRLGLSCEIATYGRQESAMSDNRLDHLGALERDVGSLDPVEEELPRAEQDGRDRQRQLVDEAGREVLP